MGATIGKSTWDSLGMTWGQWRRSRTPRSLQVAGSIIATMTNDNLTDENLTDDSRTGEPTTLVLREANDDGEREQAMRLLVAAGWNADGATGTMIVAFDSALAAVVGAGVATRRCHCTFELLMWAYTPDLEPSATLDQRLVRAIGDNLRRNGGHRIVARVSRSSVEQVAVLLACGFVASESSPSGELSLEL